MHSAPRWRNALFAIFFLMGFAFAGWLARIPHVRDSLGAGTDQMGLMLLGISLGSVSGLLVASHVIHYVGTRRIVGIGLPVFAVGMAIAGWGAEAGSVAQVVAGFVIGGLFTGIVDVAANVSAAANERMIGKPIMPIFHAFFSFGTVAGAGVGALCEFLDISLGLQASAVAVIVLIVVAVSYRELAQDVHDEEAPVTARDRVRVWKEPVTILIGLMVLGMALTEGSANDWLALLMVDGHGFDRAGGAVMFALFLTAMTTGRLAGVALLARFGRVPVLRTCAAMAAAGLSIVIFVDGHVWAIVGTVLWGFGASLGFPVGMSAAADDARLGPARVGAVSVIGYLAFLAGPPLLGLLGEALTLRLAMLVVLGFVVMSFLVTPAAREGRSTTTKEAA